MLRLATQCCYSPVGEDDELETEDVDDCDADIQLGEKALLRVVERRVDADNPALVVSYCCVQLTALKQVYGSAQYSRIELEPRHIIAVTLLFELQDCEEMHAEHPATFHLPCLQSRPTYASAPRSSASSCRSRRRVCGRVRGCGCASPR